MEKLSMNGSGVQIRPASEFASGEPGLYAGVPENVYHALDACSNSRLSLLKKSPAHLRHAIDNPQSDTPSLLLGRATHSCILEPDLFKLHYARFDGDKRTKAGKDEWAALAEAYGDEGHILRADDYEKCLAMLASVQANDYARGLLRRNGHRELSALFVHEPTGLLCKLRVDLLSDAGDDQWYETDVKTTRDASPRAFSRSIYNYGYHRQRAIYRYGLAQLGIDVRAHFIIAVESDAPYATAVYRLHADDAENDPIKAGWDEAQPLFEKYAECAAAGLWPAYEGIMDVTLPRWAFSEIYDEYEVI